VAGGGATYSGQLSMAEKKFVYIFNDVELECTVEMPECRNTGKKVSPASLVLPLVRCVSPTSAFRHRPQSGTAGHGLIR
jgi:hypothetical protein